MTGRGRRSNKKKNGGTPTEHAEIVIARNNKLVLPIEKKTSDPKQKGVKKIVKRGAREDAHEGAFLKDAIYSDTSDESDNELPPINSDTVGLNGQLINSLNERDRKKALAELKTQKYFQSNDAREELRKRVEGLCSYGYIIERKNEISHKSNSWRFTVRNATTHERYTILLYSKAYQPCMENLRIIHVENLAIKNPLTREIRCNRNCNPEIKFLVRYVLTDLLNGFPLYTDSKLGKMKRELIVGKYDSTVPYWKQYDELTTKYYTVVTPSPQSRVRSNTSIEAQSLSKAITPQHQRNKSERRFVHSKPKEVSLQRKDAICTNWYGGLYDPNKLKTNNEESLFNKRTDVPLRKLDDSKIVPKFSVKNLIKEGVAEGVAQELKEGYFQKIIYSITINLFVVTVAWLFVGNVHHLESVINLFHIIKR